MRRGFLNQSIATTDEKRAVADRYLSGESGRDLAKQLCVSDHTIYCWLRELGVERRSIKRAVSMKFAPIEQRFDEKHVLLANGCWHWTAGLDEDGYPRFESPGENSAHRYSYTRFIGAIPSGHELDHTCKNRACVNPAHLEPVTHLENVRRAWRTA